MRRCHGIDVAMKLVRVGRLVGLAGTSNVAGADRYHALASGTMAHSFVQAFEHEIDAFRAYADAFGEHTVLLVDTYDSERGIERAIDVARECQGRGVAIDGIRIDSGDLAVLACHARARLNAEGMFDVRVYVSGGLDEFSLHRLAREEDVPIDAFGVGTALGVSEDAPALDTVYKLVEFDGRPVRKLSTGKESWPGPKQVWRADDWSADVVALAGEPGPDGHHPLLDVVMENGVRTGAGARSLDDASAAFDLEWERVPPGLLALRAPDPYPVTVSAAVREQAAAFDRTLPSR
jgi:nicotinate phosphoribosyltransferase